METPVLFLIFNRPIETLMVFEQIRLAKPKKLFIASDGPRENRSDDVERCNQAKSVVDMIDWDCEVFTLFRTINLGCGRAVSSAIDWFFENVEEGIIIEDDCLPNQSFFIFCTELLRYYRNEEKIMHISGSNHQLGNWRGEGTYYFSRTVHIWGWASWRRAWKKYSFECEDFDLALIKNWSPISKFTFLRTIWGKNDTWDYQWIYAVEKYSGIAIIPNVSLIKNIGFEQGATHTKVEPKWLKSMKYGQISSIIHPKGFNINTEADLFTKNKINNNNFLLRLFSKIYIFIYEIF